MRVYHRTSDAAAIVKNGFRDGTGKYMLEIEHPLSGVFVSDVPLDCNEGACGNTLLSVVVPDEVVRAVRARRGRQAISRSDHSGSETELLWGAVN